jgi:hypothetical protein
VPLRAGAVPGGVPGLRAAGPVARGAWAVPGRGLLLRVEGLALRVAALAIAGRARLRVGWLSVSGRRGRSVRLLLLLWRRRVELLLLWRRGPSVRRLRRRMYVERYRALARVGEERLSCVVPAGERRGRA